jgi:small subunit ribosomal protein S8
MTDVIADMLTRIRNGQKSKLVSINVPYSKMKCSVLDVLFEEGYILGYKVDGDVIKNINVNLKYSSVGLGAITEVHRVSKPGKRIYSAISKLKGYYNNMGIVILTTSKGIISDRKAHSLGIGGEIICKVF